MFWKMVMRSMRRRRKELRFVSAAAFIAVFFLVSVTVFQNVMNRYVIEDNYKNYGEWVLSSVEDLWNPEQPFLDPEHPYLSREGVCSSGWEVLDERSEPGGVRLGTMDENCREIGNLTLYEGRMPQNAGEIVMDLPSLAALGYSYDLGQTVRITVQDGSGQTVTAEFALVGTMKSFSESWVSSLTYPLPGGLVTQEGLEAAGGAAYNTHFYQLDRRYEDIDADAFASAFVQPGTLCEFNSNAYGNRVWGSEEMFLAVKLILLMIAVSAVSYLLLSYEAERRKWYYQYRTIGAERSQIRKMILAEGMCAVFPWALAAQIIPHAAGALICLIISEQNQMPFFYEFHPKELLLQAGIIFGVLFLAVIGTWVRSGDKVLARNTKTVTERQLKRLRKCRGKNTLKSFYRRQGKLHPLRQAAAAVLSAAVCAMLLLCMQEIRNACASYSYSRNEMWDFSASKANTVKETYSADPSETQLSFNNASRIEGTDEGDMQTVEVEQDLSDMYYGIGSETEVRLDEMSGISRLELLIRDGRHKLEWQGKEDSPVIKELEKQYDFILPGDERICFYENFDKMRELTGLEVTDEELDEAAFNRGDQVVVYTSWVPKAVSEDFGWDDTPEYICETELHAGQKAEIASWDDAVRIPVTVGGVIAPDEWGENQYLEPYTIFGSMELAEKMAREEGKELAYNAVQIEFDWNTSFDAGEKKLASLLAEEGMDYSSNTEYMRRVADSLVNSLSIYGVTGAAILLVYLVLQMNFYKNQSFYLQREYRLLKRMGMERKQFLKLTFADSAKRSLWTLPGIPVFLALTFAGEYLRIAGQDASSAGSMTLQYSSILKEYTADPFWTAMETMKQLAPWSCLMSAAAVLLLAGIFLLGAWTAVRAMEGKRQSHADRKRIMRRGRRGAAA